MQHLAIIPDGNRRWAKKHTLESVFGHKRGMEVVKTAISVCLKKSIKYLSFYTFSIENFRRSEIEKNYLFDLLSNEFSKKLPELVKNGIRVRFIGDRDLFPTPIKTIINNIEETTQDLSALNLNLLFCYGGKAEIVHAIKSIAQRVKDGILQVNQITENIVHDFLWTAEIPDPDLIIRTGGVMRLSNFLLIQAAYSEFTFLDCYWPEMTEEILESCLEKFNNTKRNFGQ